MQTSEKWSVTMSFHMLTKMKWTTAHRSWRAERWRKGIIHTPHSESLDQPSLSFLLCLFLSTFSFSSTGFTQTHFSLFTSRVRKCWYRRSLWCYRVTLYSLQQHPYFSFISLPLSHSLPLLWGFSLFLSISNTKIVKLFSNIRQFHIFLLKCS